MTPVIPHPLRLADLPQGRPTPVRVAPDAGQLAALAERLGVDALRKVRLEGELRPEGAAGWTLAARLGATVVQPCRVTTDAVTTRVEEDLAIRYAPGAGGGTAEEEVEIDADAPEPLPAVLDLGAVLEEALALAVPAFPRAEGAGDADVSAAPPGAAPLDDDAVKPFAGLAALRRRMEEEGGGEGGDGA